VLNGVLAGLAAGALWGLVFIAPRLATGISSVDLTVGRFLSFGLLSVLLMLWGRGSHRWPTAAQARAAVGLSVLGFTGYYLLLVLAIHDAGSEVPTLIIGTLPIWMMLLGRPLGLRWAALLPGLLFTLGGLALMIVATNGLAPLESACPPAHYWRGVLWAVAAMLCWTAFGLLNSVWLKRHPEVSATEWTNWLGVATGAGALLLWVIAGSPVQVLLASDGWQLAVVLCVATGVGSAWLATILWNMASRHMSASLCGQLIVSETVFGLLYSFVLDGHWPTSLQLWACGLFVLGIIASVRAHT
jgi:drug/metabolite transporter (DMT)-like permease